MATMMTLRALTGDLRGQEFTIRGPARWVVGRSRSCRLRLPGDATVSRQHCLIELEGGSAWVQDLGSRNGTHLNGVKIVQFAVDWQPGLCRKLQDGDELQVCSHIFAVVVISYTGATTPRPFGSPA